jgi:hypothetical protein
MKLNFSHTTFFSSSSYVLPTNGSKVAIGLGATVVFTDSNVVSRPIIINGGSINALCTSSFSHKIFCCDSFTHLNRFIFHMTVPLTFQSPVILRLSGEDFTFNVSGNSTFNNLTIALFNRNSVSDKNVY